MTHLCGVIGVHGLVQCSPYRVGCACVEVCVRGIVTKMCEVVPKLTTSIHYVPKTGDVFGRQHRDATSLLVRPSQVLCLQSRRSQSVQYSIRWVGRFRDCGCKMIGVEGSPQTIWYLRCRLEGCVSMAHWNWTWQDSVTKSFWVWDKHVHDIYTGLIVSAGTETCRRCDPEGG